MEVLSSLTKSMVGSCGDSKNACRGFAMSSASFKVRGKDMLRLLTCSTAAKEGTSRTSIIMAGGSTERQTPSFGSYSKWMGYVCRA